MSRVRYPKRLFYDDYLEALIEDGWGLTPEMSNAMRQARGDREHPLVRLALAHTLQRLRSARVRVITKAVMELVLETAMRLSDRSLDRFKQHGGHLQHYWLDPLPPAPQWFEFEGFAMGEAEFPVRAIWLDSADNMVEMLRRAVPHLSDKAAGMPPVMPGHYACLTSHPHVVKHLVLYPPSGPIIRVRDYNQSLELVDSGTGERDPDPRMALARCWSYHQGGVCSHPGCHLARRTREGVPFALHGVFHEANYRLSLIEQAEYEDALPTPRAKMGEEKVCTCYRYGFTWNTIIYALFNVLRAEGMPEPERHSFHVEMPPTKRSDRQRVQEEVQQWNTTHPPRYEVLSLSGRWGQRARLTRNPATGRRELAVIDAPDITIEHQIDSHKRVLVPGENKPWKEWRIVDVRGHKRRYHVRPGAPQVRQIVVQ